MFCCLKLGGLVVLAIGLWMLIDRTFINDLIGTNLFQGSIYVLIATGALITFISFFGCMGAAKEVKCLLLTVILLWVFTYYVVFRFSVINLTFKFSVQYFGFHLICYTVSGGNSRLCIPWESTNDNGKRNAEFYLLLW